MTQMEKLKLLINQPDAADELLLIYLERAEADILGYCNVQELPVNAEPAKLELAAMYFNKQGIEGATSYGEGGVSYGYGEGIPGNIKSRIQKYVKGTVLG